MTAWDLAVRWWAWWTAVYRRMSPRVFWGLFAGAVVVAFVLQAVL